MNMMMMTIKDFSPLMTKINRNLFKYSVLMRSKH